MRLAVTLSLALTVLPAVTFAQEQPAGAAAPATSSVQPPASPPSVPSRGTTMEAVRGKFGAPSQESAAVGKPPITRWDYPGYSVFFENDKVLHTVVAR